jgi:hypothetical protein
MKPRLRTSSPLPAAGERVVTHGGLDAALGEITDDAGEITDDAGEDADDAGEDAQDRQALERWLDDGGAVPTDDESR